MINVDKQVSYWKTGAEEDFVVARKLILDGHSRQGLFFLHLTLEKVLKAHVCKTTRDLAPRIHDLVKLAKLSALNVDSESASIMAEINAFNLKGRYPENFPILPSRAEAERHLAQAERVYQWLMSQL